MDIVFRLYRGFLILGFCVWATPNQGQDMKLHVGFSLASEMTTGTLAAKQDDPLDLLRNVRFTYNPQLHLHVEFFPWAGLETGIYQKDRGIGEKNPILDPFGNTVGQTNYTTHYTYLGFPLKVRLKWQDLYFSAGPSLEMLTGLASYYNGEPIATVNIPARNMEIIMGCQFGWEGRLTSSIRGFVGIQMDAQWLRPLLPSEYRFASMGINTGLSFEFPELK